MFFVPDSSDMLDVHSKPLCVFCFKQIVEKELVLLAIAVFLTISSDSLPATSNPRISTISLLLFTYVMASAIISYGYTETNI
jgi:hypothetical protein